MSIGYKLYKNNMPATSEKAPYLGMAVPAGSLAYDNILKEMIKAGTKMTQPTAKYFLDALYEYAAETIAAEKVRICLGSVSIYPMIDGSFDAEDSEFDPKRNSLYVGASFAQELRDLVAGIAPDYAGDASVGSVKLHSCMDLETQSFKVIRGTGSFRLAGANLTVPDGSDESLALYAKNGVDKVADIVVSETDGGQRITCHLSDAAEVPVGTYKVRLASHGLDPTDPLTVVSLTVTLVEAVPAPPEPLVTSSDGFVKVMSIDEDPIPALDSFTVRGVNVGYKSGDAEHGLPDHGLMGALATVDGQPLTWHCTAFDDEHASEATFESDGSEEPLEPGEYTAALTLNYAVDDGTGGSHLEPLVIENVKFTVGE